MKANFGNRQVVIKALTGSHNYNLNTVDSDEDFKVFVMPTFEDLYKGKMFSTGKQSDDLDFTAHDIRQLSNLLWKSNPNFVEVLFSVDFESAGDFPVWLRENRQRLSRLNLRAFGFACLGMHKEKMNTLFKGTAKTQWIVDEFGFDTKGAHHAMRMLFLAERVAMGLDMGQAFWFNNGSRQRELLMNIKNNMVGLDDFMSEVRFWNKHNFDFVESFFKSQEPDTALRLELEERTMRFVKEGVA